jgi:hypothetical protein
MLRQSIGQAFKLNGLLFQATVVCGSGLLLGIAALWLSPLIVLGILAGVLFIYVAFKRPEISLLAILVATSSIVFEDRLPLLSIGIGSFHLPDILLLMFLGSIVLRLLVEPGFKFVHTPLDLPLGAFYGVALASTILALMQSAVPTELALREMRVVSYYLTFFIVTNLVRRKTQLIFLLRGLMLLGILVAGAMVAQFIVGDRVSLFPGRVETLVTQGASYANITRILPPGQSLVMVLVVALVALLAIEHSRPQHIARFLQTALMGVAVLLTFNRNFWVGVALGLVLLVCLVGARERQKLVGWVLVAISLGAVVLVSDLASSESQVNKMFEAAFARLATLASDATPQESSLQARYVENSYGLAQIEAHPFLGLGLGARYRPFDSRIDWGGSDNRAYIHNGHLWILLKTGFVGYACLIWLSVVFVLHGLRSWRRISDTFLRAIVLAFVLSYIGVLVAALVSPIFTQWYWSPVIGIMWGVNETILKAPADGLA